MRHRTLTPLLAFGLMAALLGGPAPAQDSEPLELIDLGHGLEGNAFFSPYEDLDLKVLGILDRAKPGSTVYQSYYSLSYTPYFNKYKELTQKGCTVKVNLWQGSFDENTDSRLKKAGVDNAWILNIRKPPPDSFSSMHTKITVVQDKDDNYWVITGSANLSNSASLANHEHIIILRSDSIAREFIKEFEEQRAAHAVMEPYEEAGMSGESDPKYREMVGKLRQIDRPTKNDYQLVQTYFSPDDRPRDKIVAEIRKARKSIKIAMYTFYSPSIANALRDAAERGVKVTCLLDAHQHEHSDIARYTLDILEQGGCEIIYARTHEPQVQLGNYASLHHKYAIIDDETVVGGSFNWTGTANAHNDENMTVVRSEQLAGRFNRDFSMMLGRYAPADLARLRSAGLLPQSFAGETTRVLFAVSYTGTDAAGKNAWDYDTTQEVVVVGNIPALGSGDPAKGLVLRGSRSVSPRMLGSIDLPRGVKLEWRVCIRDKRNGSLAGTLAGNNPNAAETQSEKRARVLEVDPAGTPMIAGPIKPENLTTGALSWSPAPAAPAGH